MSEKDQEHTQSVPTIGSNVTSEGYLHLEATTDQETAENVDADIQSSIVSEMQPATTSMTHAHERTGTAEHLAAQRAMAPLDINDPHIKHQLMTLRAELTRLLTSLRWEDMSIEETASRLQSLLTVGPIQQWQPILLPFLYEIDRTGTLIPIWLYLIEQGDPDQLPSDANPAETPEGRARRYAILMISNYRTLGINGLQGFSTKQNHYAQERTISLTNILGQLATDPHTSLYATEALVKQATVPAMQALIGALNNAYGWAKVDVVKGCLAFNQPHFYELLIASGLDNAPGLESYLAIPLYRKVPLETYLGGTFKDSPRLQNNAALIFQRVLQDSQLSSTANADPNFLPPAFSRHFPTVANTLIDTMHDQASWQIAIALHQLGLFMGGYWNAISRGQLKNTTILEQIYQVLPRMHDVERWMNGLGRELLLHALPTEQDEHLVLITRALGQMHDSRAVPLIIQRLETTKTLTDRTHALAIGELCDTLGYLHASEGAAPLLQLMYRTIDVTHRTQLPRNRDNLPPGNPDIPGSIVYAAAIHALGHIGATATIEGVWTASNDLDPYVRTQALETLQQLDPRGEHARSREVVREALRDPREAIVRAAIQLILQYRDIEAVPQLQRQQECRPQFTTLIQEALQHLQ